MRLRLITALFVVFVFTAFWMGSSNGPAAAQMEDRTGSPLSGGLTCQLCHNGGQFSPVIQAQILDDTVPVTAYEPGKTYTFKITVTPTTGTPLAYGYQAVALTGAGNANGGSFGAAPAGQQVITLNGRQYPEHSAPSDTNVFMIPWTAPDTSGAGAIRFYASGNAVNLNNSSGGDGAVRLNPPLTLTEKITSAASAPGKPTGLSLYPNPASGFIYLKTAEQPEGKVRLRILDLNGKTWPVQNPGLASGLDIGHLPPGIYLLEYADGAKVVTRRFMKI